MIRIANQTRGAIFAAIVALAFAMTTGLVVSGCGVLGEGEGLEDEADTQTEARALYPLGSTLWSPADGQNTTVLNVCWENASAAGGTATTRDMVMRAVSDVWTNAWIQFNWSTTCTGSEQIRVRLEDISTSPPHTNGLGTKHGKVYLNHAFINWDGINNPTNAGDGSCRDNPTQLQRCIRRMGVHEFGHALGLAHDQNRRDTTCPNGPEQGTSGDFPMSRPDPESIMSYCPEGQWGGTNEWSALDILHIQRLYGGWDAPVVHGGTFALRPQMGWYYRFGSGNNIQGALILATSSTKLQESDGTRNMVLLRKKTGTGRIHYNDLISLQDQRTSYYYCPSEIVQIGTPACGICQPPTSRIPVTAGSTTPCYWKPVKTWSGIGGGEIHVNDPFVLWNEAGTWSFSGSATTSMRFLGDFFPN